jgi:hypothetical protein
MEYDGGEKGEGSSVLLRIGYWGEVGWRGVTAAVSGDDKLEGPGGQWVLPF